MDGLEDKLNAILSDPDAMSRIAEMAKSLTGGGAKDERPEPDGGSEEPIVRRAMKLLRGKALNGDETALLNALRPFLSSDRQRKLDRALKLARLASLASIAQEMGVFGGDDGV